MQAMMMLADYAQAQEGKLNVIGGGWNHVRSPAFPCSIAIILSIDRNFNEDNTWKLELIDVDGHLMKAPDNTELKMEGEFRVDKIGEDSLPAVEGVQGESFNFPLSVNMPNGHPVPPGKYEWRLWINDETKDHWRLPFKVSNEI